MAEATGPRGGVTVDRVRYTVGNAVILDDVSLEIAPGSFVAMVGASGAGKSSLLRVIGGPVVPDSGTVMMGGRDVTRLDARRRPTATVFQSHALFPHMTVFENVAFGLRVRGWSRPRMIAQVSRMLALVGLTSKGDRRVGDLSGGESQRVATARALAVEPDIILMDEPLAALDEQIKERLRIELKELFHRLGVTVVYVTHDQDEALVMADKIVVMGHAQILQHGDPVDVYQSPASAEVADFLGAANLIPARARPRPGGGVGVTIGGSEFEARGDVQEGPVIAVVRQEDVVLAAPGDLGGLHATIDLIQYRGASTRYGIRIEDLTERRWFAVAAGAPVWAEGDRVGVALSEIVALPDGSVPEPADG